MTKQQTRQLGLRLVQSIALLGFPDFKEFLEHTEYFLKKEEKTIIKRAEETITNDLTEDEASFRGEFYIKELDQFRDTFPQILRYSLFITLMSMTEASIVTLCNGARQFFELKEIFNHKNNIINQGIQYLENNLNIDTSGYTNLLDLTNSNRNLRNCIVHSKGRITWRTKKQEAELRKFIEATSTLELNQHGKIVILEGFVENSMDSSKQLISKLIESIREVSRAHT